MFDFEDEWILDVVEVIDCGILKCFMRKVEVLGCWFDGYIQVMGDEIFVIVFIDVIDCMEVVVVLSESEVCFCLIFQGVRDYIIVIFDEEGNIISWFGGVEDVFGYFEFYMFGCWIGEVLVLEDGEYGVLLMDINMVWRDGVFFVCCWYCGKDGLFVFFDGMI